VQFDGISELLIAAQLNPSVGGTVSR